MSDLIPLKYVTTQSTKSIYRSWRVYDAFILWLTATNTLARNVFENSPRSRGHASCPRKSGCAESSSEWKVGYTSLPCLVVYRVHVFNIYVCLCKIYHIHVRNRKLSSSPLSLRFTSFYDFRFMLVYNVYVYLRWNNSLEHFIAYSLRFPIYVRCVTRHHMVSNAQRGKVYTRCIENVYVCRESAPNCFEFPSVLFEFFCRKQFSVVFFVIGTHCSFVFNTFLSR